MNKGKGIHNFHIPVMGIAYTIDTPAKVAQYGISSVISLVDDMLMEKVREFHTRKMGLPFQAITEKMEDFRAERITAYLDLMDQMVRDKFAELKESVQKKGTEFDKFMDMLPDTSDLKQGFENLLNKGKMKEALSWVQENLSIGNIDVNIMTKLDKKNFKEGKELPTEFNDAHAALRGFANSKLRSGVVLSAGMNPRLYTYLEKFQDFFPNEKGEIMKKIILKVSDFRSALVQGKFFAKKGLWVSEYRIESGLNCGGHAFASQGHLLGPILEEFKNKRDELIQETHKLIQQALQKRGSFVPETPLEMKITAQGGVGTAEEHQMLVDYYGIDSVGWGSPFLLVPEAITIDRETVDLLEKAKEDDLYLSGISPLGVPFNNLKGNSKDFYKFTKIQEGRPGAPCVKQYSALSTEFDGKQLCTASRNFQKRKIEELKSRNLPEKEYQLEYNKIVEKSCICVGLGTPALLAYDLDTKAEGPGVSVCPGPNMAYFDKKIDLKEMVQHIYGKVNLIGQKERPNMFMKELQLYVNYWKDRIEELGNNAESKQKDYYEEFKSNMENGIQYYRGLFDKFKGKYNEVVKNTRKELDNLEQKLREQLQS